MWLIVRRWVTRCKQPGYASAAVLPLSAPEREWPTTLRLLLLFFALFQFSGVDQALGAPMIRTAPIATSAGVRRINCLSSMGRDSEAMSTNDSGSGKIQTEWSKCSVSITLGPLKRPWGFLSPDLFKRRICQSNIALKWNCIEIL